MTARVLERSIVPELSIVDVQHDLYWHADGRLTVVYELAARHEPGMTDAEFDQFAESADQVWNGLPEGTSYQFFVFLDRRNGIQGLADRFPPIEGEDPAAQASEEFRRSRVREFERMEREAGGVSMLQARQHFFAATFTPSFVSSSRAERIVEWAKRRTVGGGRRASDPQHRFDQAIHEAYTFARAVEVGLLQMGLGFRRCGDGDLLSLLHRILSPSASDAVPLTEASERARRQALDAPSALLADVPFAAANSPVWAAVEDDMVVREKHLRIGDWHAAVVSLKQLPDRTCPGMLVPLLLLGRERYYLVYRVEVPVQQRELRKLAWTAIFAAGLRLKNLLANNDRTDAKADAIGKQADQTIEEVVQGAARVLGLGLNVVLYERKPEELDVAVQEVLGRMSQAYGLRGVRERYMAKEAFLSTLPGAPELVERRRTALTMEGSNLMPAVDFHWREGKVPFATPTNSIVFIDPYSDLLANANVLVTGESGTGKSFAVASLLSGYEMAVAAQGGKRPYTFILDNGGSFARYTQLMGGRFVPFSFECPPGVDVFRFEPEFDDLREHVSRLQWLALDFLHINQEDKERFELIKAVLEEALYRLFQGHHEPSWRGLRDALKIVGGRFSDDLVRSLYPYAEGKFARLFEPNPELEMTPDVHVMCYDFEGLSKHPDLALVGLRLTTFDVWRWSARVSRMRHQCFLVTDESYKMMTGQGGFAEVGGVFLEETFRQGRKTGLSVISLSQGLMEYADSKHGKAVIDNCATKFIGPPGAESFEVIKRKFQLNDRQVDQLNKLRRSARYAEFLVLQGKVTHVVRIPGDPFSRWVFTTRKSDRNRIAELTEQRPDLPLLDLMRRLASADETPRGS